MFGFFKSDEERIAEARVEEREQEQRITEYERQIEEERKEAADEKNGLLYYLFHPVEHDR